jgi:hypothetical protein
MRVPSAVSLTAVALGAVALAGPAPAAAPPGAGRGFGLPVRTVDGLDDVRAAIVSDGGVVTAALGPGGVVRIAPDGARKQVLPPWPLGRVAEAVSLAELPDGRVVVADRQGGAIAFVPADGRTTVAELRVDTRPTMPAGVAAMDGRIFVADAARPRIIECDAAGKVLSVWPVGAPDSRAGLPPVLGGIAASGGKVLVSDAANNRVVAFDADSHEELASSGDRGAFPDMWQSPAGVGFDGLAFLVADQFNHRIVRVDVAGRTVDEWGQHAVRPRQGNGSIHYPTAAAASPDGSLAVVAEPFERRVQLFAGKAPPDPNVPELEPLPSFDGVASHFSTELSIDGRTLVAFEPESASVLVFDLRNDPPIHVTTLGGPGLRPGTLGQVSTLFADEARNRIHAFDPLRRVIATFALVRDGTAPHYDPFMGRLVREVGIDAVERFVVERKVPGGERFLPVDARATAGGGALVLDAAGPRFVELDADFAPVRAFPCGDASGRLVLPAQFAVVGDASWPAGPEAWAVDAADRMIKRFALSDGAFRGALPLDGFVRPFGIERIPAAGSALRIAVSDAGRDVVEVLEFVPAKEGDALRRIGTGGGNGSKPAELWEPAAIAWSPCDSRFFVADHGNHRVQGFDPAARWESCFGIGRAYVRPKDPSLSGPQPAEGKVPSAEGAADTRSQFPAPARSADGWWSARSADGRWTVSWRFDPATPPLRDPFGMDVRVVAVTGGAPFDGTLAADAAMPHHGHGMNVAPTVKRTKPGEFRVDGMLFHMPGYWELYFDLVQGGTLERAQGTVTLE